MDQSIFFTRQLERSISQGIQTLYSTLLEHDSSQITCCVYDDKVLVGVDHAITQLENLLARRDRLELAKQIRRSLHEMIRPQIKTLIETTCHRQVIDLFITTHFAEGHVDMMAMLKPLSERDVAPSRSTGDRPQTLRTRRFGGQKVIQLRRDSDES